MANKSIIIIGSGMGGLSAGCYAQMNGYDSEIFEMHYIPGGQCTSWKRKGYTFDACIHHLFGCNDSCRIYELWKELGAMPRELVYVDDCVSVVSQEGQIFHDYFDLRKLEDHLNKISPEDNRVIKEYLQAIKISSTSDIFGQIMMGGKSSILKMLPSIIKMRKWFKPTMKDFADKFSNSFLSEAFQLLEYSSPSAPFILHLAKHGYGYNRSIAWPVGGAIQFSSSIAKKYEELGGKIHYRKKVVKILTENDKAIGVKLEDGTEHLADIVIANSDGRKTINELLDGKYIDEKIKGYCAEPPDVTNWAVHVFLGVNRDLSKEPSSLVMLLDKPVVIAGHENKSIEMQLYGFDKTMAPPGKGVIKVELFSSYSYWKKLYEDKEKYYKEKENVKNQVVDIIEGYFPGIKEQIEASDVPTLMTWERYMGGTHGFLTSPNKKFGIGNFLGSGELFTLPNLDNFYFVGQWSTGTGALFSNALSGRKVIEMICKKGGKKFTN